MGKYIFGSSESSGPSSVSSRPNIRSRKEISCVRRFWHDLLWLWEFLADKHPSWILPGLPQKSFILSITDSRKLIAKAEWYQDAMADLLSDHWPSLRVERVFFEWLF